MENIRYHQYKPPVISNLCTHITYLYYADDNTKPENGGVFVFALNPVELGHDNIDYKLEKQVETDDLKNLFGPGKWRPAFGGGVFRMYSDGEIDFLRNSYTFPNEVPQEIRDNFVLWFNNQKTSS